MGHSAGTVPVRASICLTHHPHGGGGISKLDKCCISNPKSEILNWTRQPHLNRTVLVVQSEISDFGFEMQDSSNFEISSADFREL